MGLRVYNELQGIEGIGFEEIVEIQMIFAKSLAFIQSKRGKIVVLMEFSRRKRKRLDIMIWSEEFEIIRGKKICLERKGQSY